MKKFLLFFVCSLQCLAQDYASTTKYYEGFKNKVYQDTRGNYTIGWGFNLSDKSADAKLSAIGRNKAQYMNGATISVADANKLLNQELSAAERTANKTFLSFSKQPDEAKIVLVDMTYSLGPNKIRDFKKFKAAIDSKDYKTAAKELENSRWYTQTGRRAKAHVEALKKIPKS